MKKKNEKIRVNITVDKELLSKAKGKLDMFGGKVSTLFNAYLSDFVKSLESSPRTNKELKKRILELEKRLKKLEDKRAQ